jgi:hypothetical protein
MVMTPCHNTSGKEADPLAKYQYSRPIRFTVSSLAARNPFRRAQSIPSRARKQAVNPFYGIFTAYNLNGVGS